MPTRKRSGAGSRDLTGEVEAGEDWRNGGGNPNSRTVHTLMDPSPAKPSLAHLGFLSLRRTVPACERSSPGEDGGS